MTNSKLTGALVALLGQIRETHATYTRHFFRGYPKEVLHPMWLDSQTRANALQTLQTLELPEGLAERLVDGTATAADVAKAS